MAAGRCPSCSWLFTAEQWDYSEAEGFDCPIHLEPEPTTPRRGWSWLEARLAHAPALVEVSA